MSLGHSLFILCVLVPSCVYKWSDGAGSGAQGLPLCLCCVHCRKDQTEVASGPGSTKRKGYEWLGNSLCIIKQFDSCSHLLFFSEADQILHCFWICFVSSVVPVVWLLLWVSRDHRPPVQTGPVVHHIKGRHHGPRAVPLAGGPCACHGLWPHVRMIPSSGFCLLFHVFSFFLTVLTWFLVTLFLF